jgi:lysophospholipase L1-like esterase
VQTINKQTITIDLKRSTVIPLLRFIQGDTNQLEIVINDNGQVADFSNIGRIVTNFKRKDRKVISRLLTNHSNNKVLYQFGLEENQVDGESEIELQFFSIDNKERISTHRFKVLLFASIGTDEIHENNGDLPLLQKLFGEVESVKQDTDIAAQYASEAAEYAVGKAEYAQAQGDYVESKKPIIDKFTGDQTNLQAQLDVLVVEGDSSPAATQARVDGKGTTYATLKQRLDTKEAEFASGLAEIANFETFYKNPKTGKKIVIVGDSTSDINSAPALDARLKLYTNTGGLLEGATIINRGDSGQTVQNFLLGGYSSNPNTNIAKTITDQGDLYVVSFGINDIRAGASSPGRSVAQITADLKTLINRLLNETKGYILMRTPNPFLTDAGGFGWVSPNSNAQLYSDQLYQIYESFRGYDKRLDVIDIPTKVFGKESLFAHPLMLNQLHPNANGYRAIADEIATHISHSNKKFDFDNADVVLKGVVEVIDTSSVTFSTRSDSEIKVGDTVYIGNAQGFVISSEPQNLNSVTIVNYKWKVLSSNLDTTKYGIVYVVRKRAEVVPIKTTDYLSKWSDAKIAKLGNAFPAIKTVIDLQSYGLTGISEFQVDFDYLTSDTNIIKISTAEYLNNVADINTITGGVNVSTVKDLIKINEVTRYYKSNAVNFTGQRYLHLLLMLETTVVADTQIKFGNLKFTVNGIPINMENLSWVPHVTGDLTIKATSEPKLLVTKEYADNIIPNVIANKRNWMENKVTKATTNPSYFRAVVPISLSGLVDFTVNFNAFTRSGIASSIYSQIFLNSDPNVITGGINLKGTTLNLQNGLVTPYLNVHNMNTTGYTHLHLLLAINNSATGELVWQVGDISLKAGANNIDLSGITWSLYSPEAGATLTTGFCKPDSLLTYEILISELKARGLIS